jgi:hypothetical protein
MTKKYCIAFFIVLFGMQFTDAKAQEMRIHHTVFFKLKWAPGSAQEKEFFEAAKKLAAIPGVEKFQSVKEVSKNNKFELGLTMEFANQKLYEDYLKHPDHVAFVEKKWKNEVEDFMEIDYQVIK